MGPLLLLLAAVPGVVLVSVLTDHSVVAALIGLLKHLQRNKLSAPDD